MKSNTLIVFPPVLTLFFSALILFGLGRIPYAVFKFLILSAASCMFLGTAFAQIRSGYFWRNCVPGNRGKSKQELPKLFVLSNLFHLAIGATLLLVGVVGIVTSLSAQ